MRLARPLLTYLLLVLVLVLAASPADAQKQVEAPSAPAAAADVCEIGTAQADLDVAGVRARLYDIGGLFWRGSGAVYEVPQGTGLTAVFSSALWVGGRADGDLRFSGSTYGPWEYWPGPLDAAAAPSAGLCTGFDRIWVVSATDLVTFEDTDVPTDDLAAWPVGAGAPFFVDGDGDGAQSDAEPTVTLRPGDAGYDPARSIDLAAGERPVVFGAQTAWWVMNDRGGEHRWSETAALGVEVRVTAWAIADEDRPSLFHSTFYRYEILNRSGGTLEGVRAGIFTDADLGQFGDDYIHTDPDRSMFVFYNGDEDDEGGGGYGVPPALGVDLLSGADVGMYWTGGGTFTSDPGSAEEAYDYLQAIWKDGEPLTLGADGHTPGSTERTHWAFAGDPVTEACWSEENTDGEGRKNTPADRRGVLGVDVGRMLPGEERTLDIGFLFAQGGSRLNSVERLRGVSDDAQAAYASGDLFRTHAATLPPPPPPAPTAAPGLVGPAAHAVFGERPATFEWTPVAGANGYRLEVSVTPGFEDPSAHLSPTSPLELPPEAFPPNQGDPVYWRVLASNDGSLGPPSEARRVTLYHFVPGPLTYAGGQPAFVEVVGPGGVDPCGPDARSVSGCSEVFGNNIYASFNSTGDYVGGQQGTGPEGSIGAFAPSEFEIRFTPEGSIAYYPFTTGTLIRVPFEVWDIGQVNPGEANDPADDVRMIPTLFADTGLDECTFGYGGPTIYGQGGITQRIYAYYPTDNYDAFEAEAAPLVEADPAGCPADPATAGASGLIDLDRGRPLQRFVLEQGSTRGLDALEGAVIRFYTADRLPVAADDERPETEGLAVSIRPNPSASAATVAYHLAEAGPVRLRLVDVLGREVAVLADGDRAAGDHRAPINTAALAPGLYLVVLDATNARVVQAMTVAR